MSYRTFRSDADDLLWSILLWLFVVGLFVFAIKAGCEEQDRRAVIRRECKPIRHISGEPVVMWDGKNTSVGFTSDQTCYRCQDGFEECF